MGGRNATLSLISAAVIALLGVSPALASTAPDPIGPMGSSFARVRFVETVLTLERPAEGEVFPVSMNSPVTTGDVAGTGDGRAEIDLADSSRVMLDAGTRVVFRALTDATSTNGPATILVLERGAVRLDVGDAAAGEGSFEIDTAAGTIYLLSGGSFRIEVRNGETTLASYRGAAELSGDEGSVLLRSGQRSVTQVERAPSEPRRWLASDSDALDRFHDERLIDGADGDADANGAQEILPEEVQPYASELAASGTWSSIPVFGRVWKPACAATWSPYARGYWTWNPAGWIWVSSDPWGWAPYHYGRWQYVASQGWFWIPGSVWGGAWVAFAIGPAHVGWCPLDYWNRPAVQERADPGQRVLSAGLLDARGWQFALAEQFSGGGADRVYLRSDRLPRGIDLALTRALPPMRRAVAARQGASVAWLEKARGSVTTLPIAAAPGTEPVSFRILERASAPTRPAGSRRKDAARAAHGSPARPAAPRPSQVTQAPASAGTEPAAPGGHPRGSAVDRLIGGTRPPTAPPPAATAPDRDRKTAPPPAAPRPQPKAAPRQPHPPDDAPKPPADDQHDQ